MYSQNFLTAFPGSQFEVWLTVARKDKYVVDHWTAHGVHNGTLYSPSGQPIPPTGKNITLKGTLTSQVEGRQGRALLDL